MVDECYKLFCSMPIVSQTLTLNSWVIPEFPSTAVLMLLLIAIPIVLVAYKKKGLSNSKFNITLKQ